MSGCQARKGARDGYDDVTGDGAAAVFGELAAEARRAAPGTSSKEELLDRLEAFAKERAEKDVEDNAFAWDEARGFISEERVKDHVFKQPAVLDYIASLQEDLLSTGVVGKSNSLADIVKTVYRELLSGEEKDYRTPPSAKAVAQCMMQYQNSHRPQDLWHFVTPGFRKSVIWAQLRSGDNRDMPASPRRSTNSWRRTRPLSRFAPTGSG